MITYRLGLFEARDTPAEALQAKGWTFNAARKCWVTPHLARAAPFAATAEGEARTKLAKFVEVREAKIAASTAVVADIVIPRGRGAIEAGHDYRPYQKAFVPFALPRRSCLNADVPRLGKTIMSMAVANATPREDLQSMLIFCQANAKTQWQADHDKWAYHDMPSGIIRGTKDSGNPRAPTTIINYDIQSYHQDFLYEREWDLVVFDEAHNLMNVGSQRTRALLGGDRTLEKGPKIRAKRRIFLTGTPVWTRPLNLWPLVRSCDPEGLGRNYWDFISRYCGASKENQWDASGRCNEEELQFKLRASMMFRREKGDVMAEIPPNRQTVVLPKDGLASLVETERSYVANQLSELEAMLEARDPGVVDRYAHLGTPDEDLDDRGPLSSVRRELALAKVPMCIEWINDNVLSTEPKVVVFAHHRDVVKKIAAAYPGCAVIMGGMSETQRDAAKERFQTDPDCRVIVCNIRAGGTAISLSASDVVVFAEMSWVPSEMDQAEERIWLYEKTVPMSVYRLVVENSLDSIMAHILDVRQESIERTLSKKFLADH